MPFSCPQISLTRPSGRPATASSAFLSRLSTACSISSGSASTMSQAGPRQHPTRRRARPPGPRISASGPATRAVGANLDPLGRGQVGEAAVALNEMHQSRACGERSPRLRRRSPRGRLRSERGQRLGQRKIGVREFIISWARMRVRSRQASCSTTSRSAARPCRAISRRGPSLEAKRPHRGEGALTIREVTIRREPSGASASRAAASGPSAASPEALPPRQGAGGGAVANSRRPPSPTTSTTRHGVDQRAQVVESALPLGPDGRRGRRARGRWPRPASPRQACGPAGRSLRQTGRPTNWARMRSAAVVLLARSSATTSANSQQYGGGRVIVAPANERERRERRGRR